MRLRGATTVSSLTSSNPLIVVNGNVWNVDMSNFDVNSANDEQFAQLLNINPEDIASITVLKDAAATAIYGSQGANGVIELTTKRGSRGKPRVSYSLRLTGTTNPRAITCSRAMTTPCCSRKVISIHNKAAQQVTYLRSTTILPSQNTKSITTTPTGTMPSRNGACDKTTL